LVEQGLGCMDVEGDPSEEEDDAQAGLASEQGGVSLLTKGGGGELCPSLGNIQGEMKL
jgi:hypothetical protein